MPSGGNISIIQQDTSLQPPIQKVGNVGCGSGVLWVRTAPKQHATLCANMQYLKLLRLLQKDYHSKCVLVITNDNLQNVDVHAYFQLRTAMNASS